MGFYLKATINRPIQSILLSSTVVPAKGSSQAQVIRDQKASYSSTSRPSLK